MHAASKRLNFILHDDHLTPRQSETCGNIASCLFVGIEKMAFYLFIQKEVRFIANTRSFLYLMRQPIHIILCQPCYQLLG